MLPNVELLFNFVDADPETSTEVHISSSKKRKHAKTGIYYNNSLFVLLKLKHVITELLFSEVS